MANEEEKLRRLQGERNAQGLERIKQTYALTEPPAAEKKQRPRGKGSRGPNKSHRYNPASAKNLRPMRKFIPTDEQRKLSGFKMTHKEIAAVVTNPRTGLGIDELTLERHFRAELDHGKAVLKSLIQKSYIRHLTEGSWYATAFGLRAICGIRDDEPVSAGSMKIGIGGEGDVPSVNIEFVLPGKQPEDEPIKDVTPARVAVQPRKDYPSEEPVTDAEVLPNTSGVPRIKRKRTDWMG
jgi:hypothetical protein